jgi:hypothetical protein
MREERWPPFAGQRKAVFWLAFEFENFRGPEAGALGKQGHVEELWMGGLRYILPPISPTKSNGNKEKRQREAAAV